MPSTIQSTMSIHLARFERRVWSVSVFLLTFYFLLFHSFIPEKLALFSSSPFFFLFIDFEVWNSKKFYRFFFVCPFFLTFHWVRVEKWLLCHFHFSVVRYFDKKNCNYCYDQTETFPLHWLRTSDYYRNEHPAIKINGLQRFSHLLICLFSSWQIPRYYSPMGSWFYYPMKYKDIMFVIWERLSYKISARHSINYSFENERRAFIAFPFKIHQLHPLYFIFSAMGSIKPYRHIVNNKWWNSFLLPILGIPKIVYSILHGLWCYKRVSTKYKCF